MSSPKGVQDWEEMFEQDDRWARETMEEIVAEVDRKSYHTPTHSNHQGVDKAGGTYDADGNLVCGVYL